MLSQINSFATSPSKWLIICLFLAVSHSLFSPRHSGLPPTSIKACLGFWSGFWTHIPFKPPHLAFAVWGHFTIESISYILSVSWKVKGSTISTACGYQNSFKSCYLSIYEPVNLTIRVNYATDESELRIWVFTIILFFKVTHVSS